MSQYDLHWLNKLKDLDRLISEEKTGGIKELAEKAGIVPNQVLSWFRLLKMEGELVRWDKIRRTYYYISDYCES